MISKDENLISVFLKQFKDANLLLHGGAVCAWHREDAGGGAGPTSGLWGAPEGRNNGNFSNGKTSKKLKSKYGEVKIEVPRDRACTFEPVLMPKQHGLVKGKGAFLDDSSVKKAVFLVQRKITKKWPQPSRTGA